MNEGNWFDSYDEVVRMFEHGMVPSEIDEQLKLAKGTSHDVMVNEWRSRRLFSARLARCVNE